MNRTLQEKNYELFNAKTQAIIYNLKESPIQRMLDFDFMCKRGPSVAAIVHPGRKGAHKAFFGTKEILLPIYQTLEEAAQKHPQADVLINFASFRSAVASSRTALDIPSIHTIVIIAEGIPESDTKQLIAQAARTRKTIIGPATVGGVVGEAFRYAFAGGNTEQVLKSKLYHSGSVGLVSKSGGIMNEMLSIIATTTDGIHETVCIGGDSFPCSTLLEHLLRFEANPKVTLMIAMSELGGEEEYLIAKAKLEGKLAKPLIMYVSGNCQSYFPQEVQFGHAGAKAEHQQETAKAKMEALALSGVIVPASFEHLSQLIEETFASLPHNMLFPASTTSISTTTSSDPEPSLVSSMPTFPLDYNEAQKKGLIRKPTSFTCTISRDTDEDTFYHTVPLSQMVQENGSLGQVIGLLWFKRELPSFFSTFLEQCLIICADHGPAVAGAHNAIVAARADKDLVSSLCSGLLTIGPRFGGALNEACRYFKRYCDQNIPAKDFVDEMKKKAILIPGIGHRVKSRSNPDKRVEMLKEFAAKHFPSTRYLHYALEVETVTLQKSEKLILNVDGCIAALFLDAMQGAQFDESKMQEIVDVGLINGIFVVARSIGIIGHILDQKRLAEPLYRHPEEDIFYPEHREEYHSP